jgi:hypothetical protein
MLEMFQSEFHVKQIIYFLPLNLKSQESQAVIFTFRLQDRCSSTQPDWFDSQLDNQLSNDICT